MDINGIIQSLTQYAQGQDVPVAAATIPTLNVTLPDAGTVDSKYMEFLKQAAQRPDIVNYYKNLLDQAVGDTNLAISFLEKDYATGTRQITDDLKGTLKQLGLTFEGETNAAEDSLNKRGIGMTDMGGGKVQFAGGGQPATEMGNLQTSQSLRQEAEQRSARKGIENLGGSLIKGRTSAGQGLQQTATNIQGQEQQAVKGAADTSYNVYQNNENAKAQQGLQKQQNDILSGGSSSTASTDAPPYMPNVVNQTVSYNGKTFKGNPGTGWSQV